LYEKPGNVREFDSCQGNVRDFTKSQGNVKEKISSGKNCLKLFIVSCVFASMPVFGSTGMIQVTLNMGRSAANCQGNVGELSGNFTLSGESSSSRVRVIYHNWSATKQRPHPQSVAEISHHSVL